MSVEFWPPAPPDQLEAVAVARFASVDALRKWRRGDQNRELIERSRAAGRRRHGDAARRPGGGRIFRQARRDHGDGHRHQAGKEAAYRAWADRIQKLQATFPGYIGSFVQPPQHNETGWTTVLRFDSAANLEGWLKSDARAAMVKESEDLVAGLPRPAGRHVVSRVGRQTIRRPANRPTCGRPRASFCSRSFRSSCWSSGFSIRTSATLNPAVRTFIGNAISVALTTWPLMPLAIWGFSAWLFPENQAALVGDDDADRARCSATPSKSPCFGTCCCQGRVRPTWPRF